MKKFACLFLVLMMSLSAIAMAAPVPSKSTADMVVVKEIKTESGVAAPDLVIAPVTTTESTTASEATVKAVETCNKEIEKLVASASVEEYFGEIKDSTGKTVAIQDIVKEVLKTETVENVTVNEFMPIVVENYDRSYGNVKLSFTFSTPYEKEQPVVVLVGIMNPETGEIEWVALEGVGAGEDGGIEVEFTPDILEAIQNGTALMAVVNETAEVTE